MTRFDQPPMFLVGTRFQAMMLLAITRHTDMETFDLVLFQRGTRSDLTDDVAYAQIINRARDVHFVKMPAPTPSLLLHLLRAVGRGKRLVLSAHISNPTVLSLFLLRPNLRLHSFDEGGYNIAPEGPFFKPPPRHPKRPIHLVMWALFPKGPLHFARKRSERHYTAFPTERNLFRDRAIEVDIPWDSVVVNAEVEQARGKGRIIVLPCMKDFNGPRAALQKLVTLAQGCDLVVRHPRDDVLPDLDSVLLRSPIEGIVTTLAKDAPVTVLHYNSTVGHTLIDNEAITLVDVSSDLPSETCDHA